MQARFWLAPVALFLSNLPNTALAQDPRVYLTPSQVVGDDQQPGQGLDSALLTAVNGQPIVIVTPNMSSGGGGNLGDAEANVKAGAKLVATGKAEDAEKAIDPLKKAVDAYESSMGEVEDFDAYVTALVFLANAYINAGFEDEYTAAAKKIAALRPDTAPKGANEDVAAEITKSQGKLKKGGAGTVKIATSETTYQLKVDGVDRTSEKILSLVPGDHFIVVTAPSKTPYVEKVKVKASETVSVNVNFAPVSASSDGPASIEKGTPLPKELIDFLRKGAINEQSRTLAFALAKQNKADFVVLNVVARDSSQYHPYIYVLRAKDGKLVEITTKSYTPGPAATLGSLADEVVADLVGAAYNFPEAKNIPAKPGITIVAKGAVAIKVDPVGDPDPDPDPSNPNKITGNPTKVDPYSVGVAKLSGDAILKAPPEASNGTGPETPAYTGNPDNGGKTKFKDTPVAPDTSKNWKNTPTAADNGALSTKAPKQPKVKEPRPDRGPITDQKWFLPVVGALAAGAAGTGVYFVAKPNGLDATLTWP